jgi:hypothetical protein
VKGATNDADVVVLLTDVFGEELADENILHKYVDCFITYFI